MDSIKYTYETFRTNSEYFIASNDAVDTTYFKITYPVFEEEKLNENIKKHILYDGENTPSEAARSFIDGFDEFVGDSNIENINSAWSKEVNSQVIINTPIVMTLATQVNEYSGGAHGQQHFYYINYDILKEQVIQLSDIIQKDKLHDLTQLAEKYFRKQENLKEKASLSKDFFFEGGIFALNDNFGLTKNNLIIYFNEYEIRPYSEGPTKLEIPYKDLTDILNIRGHEYIQSIL